MLDFELLEKAAKAESAGMAAISNWLDKRVVDFCRLTDPQVVLRLCVHLLPERLLTANLLY